MERKNNFKRGQLVQLTKECVEDSQCPWAKDYYDVGPFVIESVKNNETRLRLTQKQKEALSRYADTQGGEAVLYFTFLELVKTPLLSFEKFYDEAV